MIMPSLSTLLTDSAGQILSDKAPILWSVLFYKMDNLFILLFSLNKMEKYPGSFYQFGIQYFLPAMQTLYICPLLKKASNPFPISSAILINELSKFLVFIGSPPPFLEVSILFTILRVHFFHFVNYVIYKILTPLRKIRLFLTIFALTLFLEMT